MRKLRNLRFFGTLRIQVTTRVSPAPELGAQRLPLLAASAARAGAVSSSFFSSLASSIGRVTQDLGIRMTVKFVSRENILF